MCFVPCFQSILYADMSDKWSSACKMASSSTPPSPPRSTLTAAADPSLPTPDRRWRFRNYFYARIISAVTDGRWSLTICILSRNTIIIIIFLSSSAINNPLQNKDDPNLLHLSLPDARLLLAAPPKVLSFRLFSWPSVGPDFQKASRIGSFLL